MSNVVWKNSERDWRRRTASFWKGGVAMVELDFERRLERLFADHPELADAGTFAERVERRLDAGWTGRRWLIGAGGGARGGRRRDRPQPADAVERLPAGRGGGRFRASAHHQPEPHLHGHGLGRGAL